MLKKEGDLNNIIDFWVRKLLHVGSDGEYCVDEHWASIDDEVRSNFGGSLPNPYEPIDVIAALVFAILRGEGVVNRIDPICKKNYDRYDGTQFLMRLSECICRAAPCVTHKNKIADVISNLVFANHISFRSVRESMREMLI